MSKKVRLTVTGAIAQTGTWETFGADAEHERGAMVDPFHAWIVETRRDVEVRLHSERRHNRSVAPFARVAMDAAESPAACPTVVYEFATGALNVLELQAKLDLLKVYYFEAVDPAYDCGLSVHSGNADALRELWAWWQSEQEDGNTAKA
jgi:hypothetical protein